MLGACVWVHACVCACTQTHPHALTQALVRSFWHVVEWVCGFMCVLGMCERACVRVCVRVVLECWCVRSCVFAYMCTFVFVFDSVCA